MSPARWMPAVLLVTLLGILRAPASAQDWGFSGYALGVGTWSGDSELVDGGRTGLGRIRLMPSGSFGDISLDVAYEHVLINMPRGGGVSITAPGGAAQSTDWLPLDWTVEETETTSWRHRFDRLSLSWSAGPVEITAGRHAISWATTLFLTPADPFSPFDPSDPFREYRGGVDAVRLRVFPGPFSELELVVRGADTPTGTTTTALVRGQTSVGGGSWSLGGWAGAVHDDPGIAAFATGSLGSMAVRAEASVREGAHGEAVLRAALGVDRFFQVADRDLYVVVESLRDGFGITDTNAILEVVSSKPYSRGEMQVLGRHTVATQLSYQVHPLLGLSALAMLNADDGSMLFAPGASWSLSGSAAAGFGAFFGAGDGAVDELGRPASEYGLVPGIAYASVSWYF